MQEGKDLTAVGKAVITGGIFDSRKEMWKKLQEVFYIILQIRHH